MEETTKRLMMAHVKGAMDTRRRFMAEPLEWLDNLPAAPLQMLQEYPDTFRVVFGSSSQSSPIPCPMDMTKLLAFDQTYGCRGGVRPIPSAVAGPRRVLARQPSEQGPAERMANVFMSRMENIFSTMMNNGANNSGPCMGRGLSALAQSSDLGRRLPTIGFGQPIGGQLALPAPMLQVQAPPAYVEPGAAAPSAAPAAAPAAELVGVDAAAELDANGELAGMLDMLTARENAKQTTAKAAAAAAKAAAAAAPAAALVRVEAAAEPAPAAEAKVKAAPAPAKAAGAKAKGKAMGKAAAKAPPAAAVAKAVAKAVGKAAAMAPPAAAVAKAVGKAAAMAPPAASVAKAVGKAAAKAAPAPAEAKAKGKAAAKAAGAVAAVAGDDFKLGCSKCRSALIEVNQDVPQMLPKCFQCYPMFPKCSPMLFLNMFSKCFPTVL